MKYCINFYGKQIDLLDTIDEININVSKIQDLNELKDFCELHKNQRINLCINDWQEGLNNKFFDLCFTFQENNPAYNIAIRLPNWDKGLCLALKEKYPQAKVYFGTMINNWDTLVCYLNYGVSDVIIAEALGFELDTVAEIAHSKEVQVRVFPNVAQSIFKDMPDKLKFWIRPEDIETCETYIDVCEFYGEDDKQNLYYNIYNIDKKWSGSLGEIIIGLSNEINSMTLSPAFINKRIRCNRECMKGKKCQLCDHMVDLSKLLEQANLRISIKDEEEENNG